MRLGIIGAGHVGGTLGRLFEAQGHDVRFGVRDPSPERAARRAADAARTSGVADAAAFGDVILLAIPWASTGCAARHRALSPARS